MRMIWLSIAALIQMVRVTQKAVDDFDKAMAEIERLSRPAGSE